MRLASALLLIGGLLLAACRVQTGGAAAPTVGAPASLSLAEVVGQVLVRAHPAAEPVAAVVGQGLPLGGPIQTGPQSRARLDFANGAVLRLAPVSSFTLLLATTVDPSRPLTRGRLESGQLSATLAGGVLEVETPGGLATLTSALAEVQYLPGDETTSTDDLLIVSCLAGDCAVQYGTDKVALTPLQKAVVTGGVLTARLALEPAALDDFIAQNPLITLVESGPPLTRPPSALPPVPLSATLAPTPTASPPPDPAGAPRPSHSALTSGVWGVPCRRSSLPLG
jgi:hypothetical protein